jgi:hypothetical protein
MSSGFTRRDPAHSWNRGGEGSVAQVSRNGGFGLGARALPSYVGDRSKNPVGVGTGPRRGGAPQMLEVWAVLRGAELTAEPDAEAGARRRLA